jgi:hypothetical protein
MLENEYNIVRIYERSFVGIFAQHIEKLLNLNLLLTFV